MLEAQLSPPKKKLLLNRETIQNLTAPVPMKAEPNPTVTLCTDFTTFFLFCSWPPTITVAEPGEGQSG